MRYPVTGRKQEKFMENYQTYQKFLNDLIFWGSQVWEQQPDFHPKETFLAILEKSIKSAEQDVFSPFLYLSLSSSLEQDEIMLLAAALYAGLEGEILTPAAWNRFLTKGDVFSSGMDLYYQSAPLLFRRESDEMGERYLFLEPKIFLFLRGALSLPRNLPGLDWYRTTEEELPWLGTGIRLYPEIEACLSRVPGKKLVYLQGAKGSGRKLNYAYLAEQFHMSLAVVSCELLETQEQLREIRIECLLNHAMFAVELPETEEDLTPLLCWLEEEETVFLLGTRPELPRQNFSRRQYLPFSISTRKVLEDRELFETLTCSYQWEREETRLNFLGRYNFLPGRMRDILELARAYALRDGTAFLTDRHLQQAIPGISSHSLDKYASRIQSLYRMEDLILPELPKQKLLHIIHRVRNQKLVFEEWGFLEKSAYGNGVSMIFAGPPGTGKTMAAQVMASELNMELYRVELPAVVDKYIGETEKKLNRIFGEAEKSMAILFFDEADVLFSKRTEIKESNDRYSNMEIAFLLQKMEEYEGVSILATNYLQNFDSAFRRRISDIIDFPLPDAGLRRQMWQSMIPAKLPVSGEIDFDFLAGQFEITGSLIKNALIYASFLAAETQNPLLDMGLILKGLSHELEKSGKKLSRKEYGEYGHLF